MFKTGLFKGKRILVTGDGTGLGKAMSERFLELRAELFICGRRGNVLDETARELTDKTGGKISTFVCDIRVPQTIEEMLDKIWSNGSLNGLVNNAAGNSISKSDNLSPRGFDAISNIVMNGTFYVTRACVARWIKAGVAAMTQSLALEWGNRGIRLNAIAPGPFATKGAWDRLMPNENLARNYTGTVPMGALGNIPNSQI